MGHRAANKQLTSVIGIQRGVEFLFAEPIGPVSSATGDALFSNGMPDDAVARGQRWLSATANRAPLA